MNSRSIYLTIALVMALSACGLPAATPVPSVPAASSVPALTLETLRNATYTLPTFGNTVTLTDGGYRYENGPEKLDVILLDVHATGDLNGDGAEDAAVILGENSGGSGTFESVIAVYNDNGMPVQAGAAQLGDRVLVKSAVIQNGEITLDMMVHGPNDGLCCPSLPNVQTYRMIGGHLWLTRVISNISGNAERIITVSEPVNGAEVSNPFTVTGDVTIAPFENTLAVRIFLPDGTVVNESPLMVVAPDMGAPGTFSRQFDLSNAGITGLVIIQFVEVSMADGSTLALGSVVVNVK